METIKREKKGRGRGGGGNRSEISTQVKYKEIQSPDKGSDLSQEREANMEGESQP